MTWYQKRKISYHAISGVLLAGFLLVGVFCFSHVFYRTWEALRDLGLSLAFYFTQLFDLNIVTPTVAQFPRDFMGAMPQEWSDFAAATAEAGRRFITAENFFGWLGTVLDGVYYFMLFLSFALPLVFLSGVLFWLFLRKDNRDYDKNSRPLTLFLKVRKKALLPAKGYIKGYGKFVKNRKRYWIPALCIWAYFLNVGTITLELFAWLLYFTASFDIVNLYVQAVKLVSDILPAVRFFPWWVWAIVAAAIIDMIRKRAAVAKLRKFEEKNKEFIDEQPIVLMVCGSMRKKKTTIISDMQLSLQEVFRAKALDDMRDIDNKFPFFPWGNFERFLKMAYKKHTVYSLAKAELLISSFQYFHEKGSEQEKRLFLRKMKRRYGYRYRGFFFGYDETYGLDYDSGIKIEKLFWLMKEYAKLYLIYVNQTLIVSNYTVRSDKTLKDKGNFPMYKGDFFDRKPEAVTEGSEMSHILDFDMLRLGRKDDEKNPYKDAFEAGIIGMTEIGKERGNQLDMKGLKQEAKSVNQLNDMFNTELKMIGHSATVYYYPYVRFLCDDQRPESWGADARELCNIIQIVDGGKKKIVLPLFGIEEALYLIVSKTFRKIYDGYRYRRGDNTLTMYFLKRVNSLIYDHYKREENKYSVATAKLTVEAGTMDGGRTKAKYYLCTKKIYADRFPTDCYNGYYVEKARRSKYGLNDIPQYSGLKPTYAELDGQHSLFIKGISKAFKGELDGVRQETKTSSNSKNTRA